MKKILTFIIICFGLTFFWDYLIVYPNIGNNIGIGLIAFSMFIPSISNILTRLITKDGFDNLYLKPNFKINWKNYLVTWLLIPVLIIIGTIVYFIFNINQFTLDTAKQLGISYFLLPILISPIINFIPCFGEEFGWRGYLLPKLLEKFSERSSLIIHGIVWGLWHMPLVVVGYNYGVGYLGYPFTGVIAMVLFCVVVGIIFGYMTIKQHNIYSAIIAHASINGIASIGLLFLKDQFVYNPFIGPTITGILGGLGFIILSIYLYLKVSNKAKA